MPSLLLLSSALLRSAVRVRGFGVRNARGFCDSADVKGEAVFGAPARKKRGRRRQNVRAGEGSAEQTLGLPRAPVVREIHEVVSTDVGASRAVGSVNAGLGAGRKRGRRKKKTGRDDEIAVVEGASASRLLSQEKPLLAGAHTENAERATRKNARNREVLFAESAVAGPEGVKVANIITKCAGNKRVRGSGKNAPMEDMGMEKRRGALVLMEEEEAISDVIVANMEEAAGGTRGASVPPALKRPMGEFDAVEGSDMRNIKALEDMGDVPRAGKKRRKRKGKKPREVEVVGAESIAVSGGVLSEHCQGRIAVVAETENATERRRGQSAPSVLEAALKDSSVVEGASAGIFEETVSACDGSMGKKRSWKRRKKTDIFEDDYKNRPGLSLVLEAEKESAAGAVSNTRTSMRDRGNQRSPLISEPAGIDAADVEGANVSDAVASDLDRGKKHHWRKEWKARQNQVPVRGTTTPGLSSVLMVEADAVDGIVVAKKRAKKKRMNAMLRRDSLTGGRPADMKSEKRQTQVVSSSATVETTVLDSSESGKGASLPPSIKEAVVAVDTETVTSKKGGRKKGGKNRPKKTLPGAVDGSTTTALNALNGSKREGSSCSVVDMTPSEVPHAKNSLYLFRKKRATRNEIIVIAPHIAIWPGLIPLRRKIIRSPPNWLPLSGQQQDALESAMFTALLSPVNPLKYAFSILLAARKLPTTCAFEPSTSLKLAIIGVTVREALARPDVMALTTDGADVAVETLLRMVELFNMRPDTILLSAITRAAALDPVVDRRSTRAKSVLRSLRTWALVPTPDISHDCFSAFVSGLDMEAAATVFDYVIDNDFFMEPSDVLCGNDRGVSRGTEVDYYNGIIHVALMRSQLDTAETAYRELIRRGIAGDAATRSLLVSLHIERGNEGNARAVVERMREQGEALTECALASMIRAAGRHGNLQAAKELFHEYEGRAQLELNGFHASLSALYDSTAVQSGTEAVTARTTASLRANVTMAMFQACRSAQDSRQAVSLYHYLRDKYDFKPSRAIYMLIIETCWKDGDIEGARELRMELEKRNTPAAHTKRKRGKKRLNNGYSLR